MGVADARQRQICGVSGGVFRCDWGVCAHHAGGGVGGVVSVGVVEGVGARAEPGVDRKA